MKPAYDDDDDDDDDLDELSDDFERKRKPATKSAAKSAAPVVKKPLAATTCRHGDKADDAVVWRRQADDAGRREAKAGAHVSPRQRRVRV